MTRKSKHGVRSERRLESVRLSVGDPRFSIMREYVITRNDRVSIRDLQSAQAQGKVIKLPRGYFTYVCSLIQENHLDSSDLKNLVESDGRGLRLTIEFSNPRRLKAIGVTGSLPNFLTRAMIPIIYSEHFALNSGKWFKVDYEKFTARETTRKNLSR
jgi:hypothetical protein